MVTFGGLPESRSVYGHPCLLWTANDDDDDDDELTRLSSVEQACVSSVRRNLKQCQPACRCEAVDSDIIYTYDFHYFMDEPISM